MADPRFEMHQAQLQFWAEIGSVDGGGMGRMESVEQSVPFPTREDAEQWLEDQGWHYDDHALRRVKPGRSYGLTRIREVKEFRPEKWV